MLNFREELSKIKDDKWQKNILREKVEEILKEVLKYFEKVSFEQLYYGTEIEFDLNNSICETIFIYARYSDSSTIIQKVSFTDKEEAFKILLLIKDYFVKAGYDVKVSEFKGLSIKVSVVIKA